MLKGDDARWLECSKPRSIVATRGTKASKAEDASRAVAAAGRHCRAVTRRMRVSCARIRALSPRGDAMKYLMAVGFTLVATTAAAQHPCDVDAPIERNIPSGAAYSVQFCAPASDMPEAVVAVVNGVPIDRIPIAAISDVSASGLMLYESIPFLQVTPGKHEFTLAVYSRNASGELQVGPPASPLVIFGR
jgi:hypothetical protein